jgi:dTDP-4-dehydrorhamnose 3,5-epimerase
MGHEMIEGVILTPLKQIVHPKGNVFHGMKKSDSGFKDFGEAYFSTIIANDIKPWKKHKEMTINLMVPVGEILFVMFDNRENSSTKGNYFNVVLSKDNYQRLTVPPRIWIAFKGIDKNLNLLLNIADMEHNPDEIERRELNDFAFNWEG